MHEFMKIMWERTHDGFFIFNVQDLHSILLDRANPFAEYFLKKPLRASAGKPIQAIFPREFAEDIYNACRHCLENGGSSHFSLTLHKPEGETSYWDVYLKARYRNHQTQILFWCRDTTAAVRLAQLKDTVSREYDGLFSFKLPGVALLYLLNGVEPVLERSNKTFDDMAALLLRTIPDLKERFIKAASKGVNITGQLCAHAGESKSFFSFDIVFIKTGSNRPAKAFVTLWCTSGPAKLNRQLDRALTPREEEMLHLVCQGVTNKSIARILGIAEGTVKKTLYNAYKKLNVQSRAEAINLLLSAPEQSVLKHL